MQADPCASNMFQIHGKTRRGRPPKYQQYWIALAMEKAAQRAQGNGQGQNSEAVTTGTDNKPALKGRTESSKVIASVQNLSFINCIFYKQSIINSVFYKHCLL